VNELYDIKGYQIHPGDLVRTYHFTGRRNKIHYLYHVAALDGDKIRLLPTEWLATSKREGGSYCPDQAYLDGISALIISGHGPGDCIIWYDRPKRKPNRTSIRRTRNDRSVSLPPRSA
jgi:hypothetical protein